MATSLNNVVPARDVGYQNIQYLRAQITAATPGFATGVLVGTLPPNAVIIGIATRVVTAVAGGTPVFSIGQTGSLASLVAAVTLTAGYLFNMPIAGFVNPTTTETEIRAAFTGGVTSGDAYVTVLYAML